MNWLSKALSFIASPVSGGVSILSEGLGMVKDGLVEKRNIKRRRFEHSAQLETAIQASRIKRAESGDLHAADLDKLSIADRGWKDDWLLFLTTMPLTVMFFEPLLVAIFSETYVAGQAVEAVHAGFDALREAPEYYWYALGLIYIDTFGFRRMLRIAIEKYLAKKFP